MTDQSKSKMVNVLKSKMSNPRQTTTAHNKVPFTRATAIRRKAYSGLMYPGAIEAMGNKAQELEADQKH